MTERIRPPLWDGMPVWCTQCDAWEDVTLCHGDFLLAGEEGCPPLPENYWENGAGWVWDGKSGDVDNYGASWTCTPIPDSALALVLWWALESGVVHSVHIDAAKVRLAGLEAKKAPETAPYGNGCDSIPKAWEVRNADGTQCKVVAGRSLALPPTTPHLKTEKALHWGRAAVHQWLGSVKREENAILADLLEEAERGGRKFGSFNSTHELAAVLREEFEEFWDSVKENNPDPVELLQVAAVALRGLAELCTESRLEEASKQRRAGA